MEISHNDRKDHGKDQNALVRKYRNAVGTSYWQYFFSGLFLKPQKLSLSKKKELFNIHWTKL